MTAAPESPAPETARPTGGRLRPTGQTVFLAVLVAVFAAYLQMAFAMDWENSAGQIGPGYFPRVIGVLGIVLCVIAIVRSLRPAEAAAGAAADKADTADEAADNGLGRHPRAVIGAMAPLLVLVIFFIPVGALVGSALFMFAVFWLLGDRRPVRDGLISVLVPLVLYLLFEVFLEAGLPQGIIPLS